MKSVCGRELVRLHTANGECIVAQSDIANPRKTVLKIFNRRGEACGEWDMSKRDRERGKQFGVHRNNLFSSRKLALADRERIYADIFTLGNRSVAAVAQE